MKGKVQRRLFFLLGILLIGISIFCFYKLAAGYLDDKKLDAVYKEMAEEYTSVSVTDKGMMQTSEERSKEAEETEEAPITVNFDAINEDVPENEIVAWLYGEGTSLNYPVGYSGDDEYFLHRSPDGVVRAGGTLFIEGMCDPDFSGKNTIIYGHRMSAYSDERMFRCLERYRLEEGYYEENPVLYLMTPEQNYKLVIYSSFGANINSEAFSIFFETDEEWQTFLNYTISMSEIETGITPDLEDRVVTLVTCSNDGIHDRTFVCCILEPIKFK